MIKLQGPKERKQINRNILKLAGIGAGAAAIAIWGAATGRITCKPTEESAFDHPHRRSRGSVVSRIPSYGARSQDRRRPILGCHIWHYV